MKNCYQIVAKYFIPNSITCNKYIVIRETDNAKRALILFHKTITEFRHETNYCLELWKNASPTYRHDYLCDSKKKFLVPPTPQLLKTYHPITH